jgi:hypothetical protein
MISKLIEINLYQSEYRQNIDIFGRRGQEGAP